MTRKIQNKGRITSDSYSIILNPINGVQSLNPIDLTERYGITAFSWESRDELKVFKPLTKVEPICLIFQNGFDLSFEATKENLDDLMDLLISQHMIFYGSNPQINGSKNATAWGDSSVKNSSPFDVNNGLKSMNPTKLGFMGRTEVIRTNDNGDVVEIPNKTNTIFDSDRNPHYVSPQYDLEVRIKHFALDKNSKEIYEGLLFKTVVFYKPSQSVNAESSFINNSFKAFSSFIEKTGTKLSSDFSSVIMNMLKLQLPDKPDINKFEYLTRYVINPSNKKLVESKSQDSQSPAIREITL